MIHYRWLRIVLVLLAVAFLPGLTIALAQEGAAAGPPALAPEVEPNDTPWEANYINGWRQGRINPVGDVDYYILSDYQYGVDLVVSANQPATSPVRIRVTLYDGNETELVSADCDAGAVCLTYRLPEGNGFYLRVTDANGNGGPEYEYAVRTQLSDPNEPNDFLSQATPYTPGQPLAAIIEPQGDVDFYVFTVEAGQEFFVAHNGIAMILLDAAGQQIGYVPQYFDSLLEFDEAGTYYLQTDYESSYYGPVPYILHLQAVDRPLLFSFTKAGTLGGVAFQPGDIVRYSPLHDTWSMHFDASDVGLRGNLVAFSGSEGLNLTYATAQNVRDVGMVRPQDVLQFYAQSLGEDTDGYLMMRAKGSYVGLTTAAERIDALALGSSSYLINLSTQGNARLPMAVGSLTAQRDDVLSLDGNSSGDITGGDWSSTLDGQAMGIRGANLIGLSEGNRGVWGYYLMYDRAVTLGGVTYQPNDVIFCGGTEGVPTCETYELAFDGALVGPYKIDALEVLYYETE